MGQRIAFIRFVNGKSLMDNLSENYPAYRSWMLKTHEDGLKEFNERLISPALENFLRKNTELLGLNMRSQPILDEMVFEFLWAYCDYGEGQGLYDFVGPLMNSYRYEGSTTFISELKNEKLTKLWYYLVEGRSYLNHQPFMYPDDDVAVGFWTKKEQLWLQEKLKSLVKNLKPAYAEGIELVLTALDDMRDVNAELILDVEKPWSDSLL